MAFFSKDELDSIRNGTTEEKQRELLEAKYKEDVKQQFIDETTKTMELFLAAMKEFPALAKAYGKESECLAYAKKGLFSTRQSEPVYRLDRVYNPVRQYFVTVKGVLVESDFVKNYSSERPTYVHTQIKPVTKSAIADAINKADIKINNKTVEARLLEVLAVLIASFTFDSSIVNNYDMDRTYLYNTEITIPYEERVERIKEYMKSCFNKKK